MKKQGAELACSRSGDLGCSMSVTHSRLQDLSIRDDKALWFRMPKTAVVVASQSELVDILQKGQVACMSVHQCFTTQSSGNLGQCMFLLPLIYQHICTRYQVFLIGREQKRECPGFPKDWVQKHSPIQLTGLDWTGLNETD